MSQSRTVARNTLFRGGGEIIAKLASLAFYVVMARELGNEGFGDFMFALSFTSVLILASGFGLDELIAREVSRDESRTHDMLTNIFLLRVVTAIPLIGLGVLVVVIGDYSGEVVLAFTLVGIGVAIENIGHAWSSVFQAFQRMEIVAVAVIAQRVSVAAVGIAVLLAGGGLVPAAIVFMAGALIGQAVLQWGLPRFVIKPRWTINTGEWLGLLKAGVPIGLTIVLFTALIKIDQTMISLLADDGNAEVGLYAAAMRLVEATYFIPWAFTAAMLPWLSRDRGEGQLARGYEVGLKVLAAVLAPIGILFITLSETIVDVLYGPDFEGAVLPLQLLGLSTVLYGFNSYAVTVMVARNQAGRYAKVLVAVLVANVISNFFLIPPYGADGAAVASIVSGTALAVISIVQVSGLVGKPSFVGAFGGPVVAGAAMAVIAIFLPAPPVVAGIIGGLVYIGVFAAWERARSREDFDAMLRLFTRKPPPEPEPAGAPVSTGEVV